KRNQWGGTLGAPIKKNKLFFFVGFQETNTRQTPSDTLAFVPTTAMLGGDFAVYASTVCQPKAVTLKAPFVGNKLPAGSISPQALAIAKFLPPATNQCGLTNFGIATKSDESFGVGKVDYQFTP